MNQDKVDAGSRVLESGQSRGCYRSMRSSKIPKSGVIPCYDRLPDMMQIAPPLFLP